MAMQIEDILKLLTNQEEAQKRMAQEAAQGSQNQPFNPQGASRLDLARGKGTPDQQRAMGQLWQQILNRDKTQQTAIGAATEGFEKGRVLMDEIRGKDRKERMEARKLEALQAGQAAANATSMYDMEQDAEQRAYDREWDAEKTEYDRQRDAIDDKYRMSKLESDALTRDQNISVNTEKQYKEFWDQRNDAQGKAVQYDALAKQFEEADYTGGVPTRIKELTKELVGNEDKQTALIKAGRSVVVSSAIQNLPPGVASDKDIELVMSPLPSQFSNPQYMAAYLKAAAKLQKVQAEYNDFALQYMDQNTTKGNKMVGLDSAWRLHKIPQGAKRYLRESTDPEVKKQFDEKYGKGMAAKVLS